MHFKRFTQLLDAQVQNGNTSAGTARKYRSGIERFIEWREPREDEPDVEEMQDFLLSLAAEEGLSGATLNVYKCAFRKYLSAVGRSEDYAPLQMWFGESFSASSGGGTPDYLSTEEIGAVREAASEDPLDAALVVLLLRTGLRVGELIALDRSDLDLDERVVRITRQKRQEIVTEPRQLTEEDVGILRAYLRRIEEYGPDDSEAAENAEELFITRVPSQDGSLRMSDATVRNRINAIGERCSHPDVSAERMHPHLFRHTVASQLGMDGYSSDEIAAYLGQASAQSAERYTHFDAEKFDDMVGALV